MLHLVGVREQVDIPQDKEYGKHKEKVAFVIKKASDCLRLRRILKKGYTSLLSSFCRWRLGNQMSAFATGFAVWRRFGIRNFLVGDQFDTLKDIFDLPVPQTNYIADWPFYVWSERTWNYNHTHQ